MSYTKGYRFSILPGSDDTQSLVHKEIQNPAYATTIAIKSVSPDTMETIVDFAKLTGALTVTADITQPYTGDKLKLIFFCDGTNRTVTLSTGFVTNSTVAVLANKSATVEFVFSGQANAWVETGRFIQS